MNSRKKTSIPDIQAKKQRGERIKMLTAYDYPSARLVDASDVDILLVGDSLAMTVLGYDSTVTVTMEEMLHHCKAAARGTRRAFLVGDMPFLSYQTGVRDAMLNAGRFLKEAHMDAVKLEGGQYMVETVKAMVDAGIPVMGHLGLTPQSVTKLGGYKMQGKSISEAEKILNDAKSLQEAGCFAIVLESVPMNLAQTVTQAIQIPTIGIGAGPHCNGQVLVFHDILGLFEQFVPKFVKQYADLQTVIKKAISDYCQDVDSGAFPSAEHSFQVKEQAYNQFLEKHTK